MTLKKFDGYTFDTESGKVTFTEVTCNGCQGTGQVEQGILCPNKWKPVNKFEGRKCPHCGAKNKNSHKVIGRKIVTCGRCDGTGRELQGFSDGLDFAELLQGVKIAVIAGKQDFNEAYLGRGLVAGVTDYGRYLQATQAENATEINVRAIVEYVRAKLAEKNYIQAGDVISESGDFMKYALLKLTRSGWHLYGIGTKYGIITEQQFFEQAESKGWNLNECLY